MGARTDAREAALQMLYALEASGEPPEQVIRDFWRELPGGADDRAYADAIVRGVAGDLARLDERIAAASDHWRLERMTRVDRNVLRLGAWELSSQPTLPRAVALDEAVELAKRFGTADSGSFVNGVLGRVANELGRTEDDADLLRAHEAPAAGRG
ncbi:MAG: transcription antitermination factor NusB [Polyangiaceae bacterium]|nr:transcription antitermination factor NusB [Polyangiaceae bacterium]